MNIIKDYIGYLFCSKCINSPIFIVGSGRSGTSILLQALGKHNKIIAFPGEAPFLTSIGGNASLLDTESANYYRASLKTGLIYFYERLAQLGIECAGGENYALITFIKNYISTKSIKTHWAAKTFPPEVVAYGLMKVFPEARFIYIYRNGIDVVHSMTKYPGFKDNEFIDQCHAWDYGVKKYLYMKELNTALCLRHEDLLTNSDIFFKTIFDFLKIDYSTNCNKFVTTNLIHPLDQLNLTEDNVLDRLRQRKSPFQFWTKKQKETFTSICSESMKVMEYTIE